MQEAQKNEVGAGALQVHDALGHLPRRPDEIGAEAIIVLDEVLETGLCPVAPRLRGKTCGVFSLMAEGVDRFRIGLFDDLGEHGLSLFLGLAHDREGIYANFDRMVVFLGLGPDIVNLLGDFLRCVAIGEVPIRDTGRHVAGRAGGPALEDFRLRIDRLRLQRVMLKR